MCKVIIIASVDKNMGIGYKNKLLFKVKEDLKRFRELTTNHTVLMGRKTFESLPNGTLPNRRNIILSSKPDYRCDGAEVFNTLGDALKHCDDDETVFVIGGGEVYKQALPLADEMYLTEINKISNCVDTYFPKVDFIQWSKARIDIVYDEYKRVIECTLFHLIRKCI